MTTFLTVTCRHSMKNITNVLRGNILLGEFKLLKGSIFVNCEYRQPKWYIHTSTSLLASKKKEEIKQKLKDREYITPSKRREVIDVWEGMTVKELGEAMGRDADYVFELMYYVKDTAEYRSPNDILAWKTLVDLVRKAELRFKLAKRHSKEADKDRDAYPEPPADESKLKRRPAVVTIMGHVDHGKTTLLDYLRKSSIVASEFGGITQHIGAFSVKVKNDSITFLDTPGHAAFKAMRSRGAHCTDIVVLVVAADDGVMEQTEESIRMAKDANVPIIVAINKIDKNDADVELTKKMIMIQGLVPEEFGGDVQCVPISALKGTNIDALTEAIIAQAELSNLRADPDGKVQGVIIETRQDTHKGKLSTALIQRGTLRKNCILTAGLAYARVRQMLDEYGNVVTEAPPSTPIQVTGWQALPEPGDVILEVESESRAREVVDYREKKVAIAKGLKDLEVIQHKRQEFNQEMKEKLKEKRRLGVKKLRPGPKQKEIQETYTGPLLSIILRTDVEGSLEAILDCLYTYYDPLCKLDIIHSEVGNVSINDVELAETFSAIIYNFNVGVLPEAAEVANKKNIPIRSFNVIYRFLEDVKEELNSRVPPKDVEEVTAEAVVQELFMVTEGKKKVPVAGSRCVSGDLKRNANYKVIRDGVEIYRGKLSSMRNLKTEVTSIRKDQECGLAFEDPSVIFQPGDVIQSYRMYTVPQKVTWDPY